MQKFYYTQSDEEIIYFVKYEKSNSRYRCYYTLHKNDTISPNNFFISIKDINNHIGEGRLINIEKEYNNLPDLYHDKLKRIPDEIKQLLDL